MEEDAVFLVDYFSLKSRLNFIESYKFSYSAKVDLDQLPMERKLQYYAGVGGICRYKPAVVEPIWWVYKILNFLYSPWLNTK